ncbi:glycosyltransferase family 2 protein [Lacibacter sp. H407]|uniref:glycosyltransferase family 2 protein n=1 Tax=Lacibacter sp. H407 TaxID=3133423 RepID=UPI0030BD322C
MQAEQLLVSVLMTAYNREKFIGEAIESVLASTYTNFELIIVDDLSVDGTVEIAQSFAAKDQRIRVYKNERNLGDYGNRNKAASFAKGDYLMYVDSDDQILYNGIELCVSAMQMFPEAGFGIHVKGSDTSNPVLINPTKAIHEHFFDQPFLVCGPGGTIQKRSFFKSIGEYPTKYGPANDMYYNLKAASQASIVKLPFDFMIYRRHEGQEINNQFSYLSNGYLYLRDAIKELNLPITEDAKRWILKKNDRRMVVNLAMFFFRGFNLKKTIKVIKKTEFSLMNFVNGVFHIN